MDEQSVSRRATLQRAGAATGLLALSGCLDFLSGDSETAQTTVDPVFRSVPTGVDLVVRADGDALYADSRLRRIVSASLRARVEGTDDPDSFRALVDAFDRTFGLDPGDVDFATGFTTVATDDPLESMAGAIVQADWAADAIAQNLAAANFSTTEREVSGYTVYDVDNEISSVGILREGRYVLGTTSAVEAVIAVESDEAEPLDDELAGALWDTDEGIVRFSTRFQPLVEGITELLPGDGELLREQLLDDLELLVGRVYTDGGDRGIALTMQTADESAAERFQSVVEGTISIAIADAPDGTQIGPTLDEITVTREGDRVEIAYTGSTQHLETVVPDIVVWLLGTGGLGIPFTPE